MGETQSLQQLFKGVLNCHAPRTLGAWEGKPLASFGMPE